ncbi:MAG TPA: HAD family hydrolase [Candidatus Paceibacterota bacterium]|nr:HAD family hydrolase [Verrucomicrobiota bacterium]HRY48240.1 HAD family hydrolase [Candidatus Paceibacterota bacterium]HSA00422.1 HAD family hydrolase [Candidatus Paceibacterota bacterium]
MSIRAILFDIYETLLQVSPPPDDASARWSQLWHDRLHAPPRLSLTEFGSACERVIHREHQAARSLGIGFPEVYWPTVVTEVVPELLGIPEQDQEEFCFVQTQLWHTVRLMPGAASVLTSLAQSSIPLGLVSNCQPYTLCELDAALAEANLTRRLFPPPLCFFSFEHGFSKPNPHVFRLMTARLAARGILPSEILMVGDRADNDIQPSKAQGWQTWQLGKSSDDDWSRLHEWLRHHQTSIPA